MTESESMYYLHTCLSYISIQPLLVFVGTTINNWIPGSSFSFYVTKQNRSVQCVVHDQLVALESHLSWVPWPKERPCWIILNFGWNKTVLITEDGIIGMTEGAAMCPVQPSKVLVPHGELLSSPTCEPLPEHGSLSVELAMQRFWCAACRIRKVDSSLRRVMVPENLVICTMVKPRFSYSEVPPTCCSQGGLRSDLGSALSSNSVDGY